MTAVVQHIGWQRAKAQVSRHADIMSQRLLSHAVIVSLLESRLVDAASKSYYSQQFIMMRRGATSTMVA